MILTLHTVIRLISWTIREFLTRLVNQFHGAEWTVHSIRIGLSRDSFRVTEVGNLSETSSIRQPETSLSDVHLGWSFKLFLRQD